jgi:hypothetical protein
VEETSSDLVTWREDGQLLGLGRVASDAPLSVRLMSRSAGGSAQHVLDLPLKPYGRYAATWDQRRARVLVMAQTASAGLDFWLVRLGLEDDQ